MVWGEATRGRAFEPFGRGYGYKAAARALGAPPPTVAKWLRRIWLPRRGAPVGGPGTRYGWETKAAAAKAVVGGGASKGEAMGRFGVGSCTGPGRWCRAYRGESGGGFEGLPRRGFEADAPFREAGTDAAELGQPWGKARLAPVVGFATREAPARDVSESPDLARQEGVLSVLREAPPAGPGMVPASDRGWQRRRPRYAAALRGHGVRQPMSRKGDCPDDAATEQLFGHLKDEFSRGRAWPDFESFKGGLDAYIGHWNERRRTGRLKGLTPAEWRRQALGG